MMNPNGTNERKRCSELELEIQQLAERETQMREELERQYVVGFEDSIKMSAADFYDRGYADGVDDTTRKDFGLG